jgi:hypothetical protein
VQRKAAQITETMNINRNKQVEDYTFIPKGLLSNLGSVGIS